MFDMLTLDELYRLHTSLFHAHRNLHARMIGPGPDLKPVISPLSDDWRIIAAACAEITETMRAVSDECDRREMADV
jgi:hypothetical protein